MTYELASNPIEKEDAATMTYELASNTIGREEIAAMHRVIDSGIFTMGSHVKQFEEAFARKFGCKYAVMVNSGSSANLLAVAAFFYKQERPLKPGDEVIVPAISWATTYYPLMQYGLKLKFVDIELDTLNMDVSKLEQALTPKTRMVAAVSILGNPCALNVIKQFCEAHQLYLFEDNCESMGAELEGKACGTFGHVNTFSSFFSHHISTMEGGMILTEDEELYHLTKSLRAHGWTRDLPKGSTIYKANADDFYEAYRFILPGYNVRPLELSGAIGVEQLKKVDEFVQVRRANAGIFTELFKNDDRFIIQKENGKSSWFSFSVILNPKYPLNRSKIMQAMSDAGIKYRIITGGNFLRHDVIKYCDHDCVGKIVHANTAHDNGFFVGNHPEPIQHHIEHFYQVIDKAAKS